MKKLALLMVMVAGLSFAQTKKVVNSEVTWKGYKLVKSEAASHNGTVNVKSGAITLKGSKIVDGNFVLDMNTITDSDMQGEYKTKLENHLKNGDFFEVDKFPTATFKIISVVKGKNKDFPYIVNGNLTAKGITNSVSFPAKITLSKGILNLNSDQFTLDRQKWGISYKSTMQDVLLKDEIDFTVKFSAK